MKQSMYKVIASMTVLLICSACTDTTTATRISPTSQQFAMKWDETVAAATTVKVNNSNLISMR